LVSGGGKASTVSEFWRLGRWTVCGHETEFSQAVDKPDEALSPMRLVGGEASISKSHKTSFRGLPQKKRGRSQKRTLRKMF